jgi:hypothetical protein
MKINDHVKNAQTGEYLGKVEKLDSIRVAIIDGAAYTLDILAPAKAPAKDEEKVRR